MPGWLGRIVAGVAGGLAGGAVFGILMQLTGTIPVVASLVDQESIAVGWAVHMSIAVFVGITYAVIFGLFSVGVPISTVLGAFYGIVWWVLGGLTLLPLRLGLGLFEFDTAAWQSLAGHGAYGLALGVVYAVAGELLARREPDPDVNLDQAGVRPLAAPEPQPAGPSLFNPPAPAFPPASTFPPAPVFPPPAAGPRSGVAPLSPAARALRQRGNPSSWTSD